MILQLVVHAGKGAQVRYMDLEVEKLKRRKKVWNNLR